MDGFGINFASKASNSVIWRWFNKRRRCADQLKKVSGNQHVASISESAAQATDGTLQASLVPVSQEHSKYATIDNAPRLSEDGLPSESSVIKEERAEQPAGDRTLCDGTESQQSTRNLDEDAHRKPAYGEYVKFSEVDPDEYTKSGGVVNGFDGHKHCPVLLLPYGFVIKVAKVLLFERKIEQQEYEARAKIEAICRYMDAIESEIEDHQLRIDTLAKAVGSDHDDDTKDHQKKGLGDQSARLCILRNELEILGFLSDGAEVERKGVKNDLRRSRQLLGFEQETVNGYLKEAWVRAEVVELGSINKAPEVPEYDVQEEYQKLVKEMNENHTYQSTTGAYPDFVTDRPTEMTKASDDPVVEKSASEQQLDASGALAEANDTRKYARSQFEARVRLRAEDWQQNIRAEEEDEGPYRSREDFDLHWVIRFRELTRAMINAEHKLSEARAAAKKAGLKLEHDDQSSCFPDDDPDDGSPKLTSASSRKPGTIARRPSVIAWVESLADSTDPDFWEAMEVDNWDSGEELVPSDSASVVWEHVARDSKRRRIDAWQQACRTGGT